MFVAGQSLAAGFSVSQTQKFPILFLLHKWLEQMLTDSFSVFCTTS